ncbi:MAG: S-layer homology domain-containing protein [Peptococcaceae bacterium]|jgi:plastocyanin|nr:S-layer homology domain-containing protein [Peptococcaceae bacterium]
MAAWQSKFPRDGGKPKGLALLLAMVLVSLSFFLLFGSAGMAVVQGTPWRVRAGASSADQSLQGLGFYPDVITIDAGDSVTWTVQSGEPHMVDFLNGTAPPSLSDPLVFSGNGTNGDNEGTFGQPDFSPMLTYGQSYTLVFPLPGTYAYQCLMHPGMQGVVVVNPAGTPYPHGHSYYDQQGRREAGRDLGAAGRAMSSYAAASSPGPDGTTVWHVANGISPAETAVLQLTPPAGSSAAGVSGTASLTGTSRGLSVNLRVGGLTPGTGYKVFLGYGLWNGGAVDSALYQEATALPGLIIGSGGDGSVSTVVRGVYAVPETGAFMEVTGTGGNPVLGGEVGYDNATVMRYLPPVLTIRQGDTVDWTQMAPQEIHTVTFLNGSTESAVGVTPAVPWGVPAGGAVFTPRQPLNSGPMFPGRSYELTFNDAGVFAYKCTVHDYMGQVGVVMVGPAGSAVTQPAGSAVQNITAAPPGGGPVVVGGEGTGAPSTSVAVAGLTGKVFVSDYAVDPLAAAAPKGTGVYFDVLLHKFTPATAPFLTVSQSAVRGDTLDWWNGSAWRPVSPPPAFSGGKLVVSLTAASSPSLDQLNGTFFAVAGATVPSDVPATYWAYAPVEKLVAKGVVNGFPDGFFRPGQAVTRAQFIKMLVLTLGLTPSRAPTGFKDVPADAWFAPYVSAAVEAGIVNGVSPASFDPAQALTREQMAVFLARSLRLSGATALAFPDRGRIDPWARGGVEAAVAAGYMKGFPDDTFHPLEAATRAQAAEVLAGRGS